MTPNITRNGTDQIEIKSVHGVWHKQISKRDSIAKFYFYKEIFGNNKLFSMQQLLEISWEYCNSPQDQGRVRVKQITVAAKFQSVLYVSIYLGIFY